MPSRDEPPAPVPDDVGELVAALASASQDAIMEVVGAPKQYNDGKEAMRQWFLARLPDALQSLSASAQGGWPARAVIEGDCIVIRVPISVLPIAFDASPVAPRDEEADPLYRVTDAATFAKGVARHLNDEEEDGTTPIHRILDDAMLEALEQGEEGIEEIAALKRLPAPGEGA
jgi:hypothetical protein